jgi:hypothetical protein
MDRDGWDWRKEDGGRRMKKWKLPRNLLWWSWRKWHEAMVCPKKASDLQSMVAVYRAWLYLDLVFLRHIPWDLKQDAEEM